YPSNIRLNSMINWTLIISQRSNQTIETKEENFSRCPYENDRNHSIGSCNRIAAANRMRKSSRSFVLAARVLVGSLVLRRTRKMWKEVDRMETNELGDPKATAQNQIPIIVHFCKFRSFCIELTISKFGNLRTVLKIFPE
ncbi:hypothetical protein V1477_002371, partial [Vespula maculifrons]